MKAVRLVVSSLTFVILSGCATSGKIQQERQLFLKNPAMGSYGYSGVMSGGEHYRFLATRDARFGEFLTSELPRTNDPRVALAALWYFGYKKSDPIGFEEIAGRIKPELMDVEVVYGITDALEILTLQEWISEIRKDMKKANQSSQPTRSARG